VQSALAKGLGVDADKITIDYAAGTASCDMGDAKPDMTALAKVMTDTNKYKATLAE
jgi:hypothetical protein